MIDLNQLLSSHQHIHENIKFADQKAIVIIGLNVGLLGTVYQLLKPDAGSSTLFGVSVCCILAIGTALGIMVIRPRGNRNKSRGAGIVDAARIGQYDRAEDFRDAYLNASDAEITKQTLIFIHDRAHIDRRKYLWLRGSLYVSTLGWIAALLFALWVKVWPQGSQDLGAL